VKAPEDPLVFASREEWRAWLDEHHANSTEAWLVHCKKGAARPCLGYEEGVEEALCFGWIDGMLKSIDGETYALRYTPRRRGSIWSESNKARAERLTGEGRMTSAGLAKIAEAKANGEWVAASLREDVEAIPPDLEQALRGHEPAWRAFATWPASRKKQYLYWVTSAKRPETRQKRIDAVAGMASGSPVEEAGPSSATPPDQGGG
jgi:uncharacterized protein YdeI (YjbR/CyaY-like superfamily)